MRSSSLRDFFTGLTAIIGIAGLSVLFIVFGELGNITARTYRVQIQAPTASGLKDTSPVTLNGVRVGQLTRIRVLPGNRGVEVALSVNHGVTIPRCVDLSVESSFVGETSLELTIPRNATDQQLADVIKPGETIQGRELRSLLSRLSESVQGPLERLTQTAEKVDALADEYVKVGQRINDLLEPRTPAEVAAGSPPNIRSAVARLDTALAGANQWLGDAELRTKAKDLLTKADTIAGQVSTTVETLKATAGKIDAAVEGTSQKLSAALGTMNDTLREVQSAAEQFATALESVNKGTGTLGQLVSNPDLYNSINDAAKRLEKALSEVEMLAQKVKAEGVKVGL